MNIPRELSDDEVLRTAAGSLSAMPVGQPPDARAIMARGRARRHRRLAGLGVAGTAAATVAALGLTGVLGGGPGPAQSTGTTASGTIRTAAFTLARNANGTVTLTLSMQQMLDPGVLQRALARDGIPALVKSGTYCSSNPAPPKTGVLSVQLPDGSPAGKGSPGHPVPVPRDAVTVINPAAIPAGAELFFDYASNDRALTFSLIYTGSYTCVNGVGPSGLPGR